MPLTLQYVARSHVGLIREGNEDSGYAGPHLLAVADGMGGHAAGEVASQAAIEELVQVEDVPAHDDPLTSLSSAISAANDHIRQLITDDPTREGMGTTVTALLWTGSALGMGHIGDSRAYLLRDGTINQLSHDHTFVQTLVDEGRITLDEASVHPARSLILKALQGQGQVDPDLMLIDVAGGDRLLICSDGLSGVVSDHTLADTLGAMDSLDDVADELIRLALAGGAPDNVTLIVADVLQLDDAPTSGSTTESFLVGAAAGDHPPSKERPRRRPAAALRVLLGGEERPRDPDELEAMRYAPRPPRRYRWVRPLVVLVAVALLGWAGLSLANNWVRTQYYVGNSAGEVAIFQGLSQEVGPIRLSELHDTPGGLPVDALPQLYKNQVEGTMQADSIDHAQQIVHDLRRQACNASDLPRPDEDPAEDPEPTGTPEPRDTAEATVEPTEPPDADAGDTDTDEETETEADPDDDADGPRAAESDPDGWLPADTDLDCTGVW